MVNLEVKIVIPNQLDVFGWIWVARSKDELAMRRIKNKYEARGVETRTYEGEIREREVPKCISLRSLSNSGAKRLAEDTNSGDKNES